MQSRFIHFLIALLLASPSLAHGQDARPREGQAPTDRLSEAKELFRQGVTLLRADDVERALVYFLRSREALPSGKNTANAAICLDRLGRYDEALEVYEELVTRYAADLDEEDRARIGPAMASLRERTGSIAVSANVEGTVIVDGRARGRLPLATAVRVLPGRHVLRVVKDGYAASETAVEVDARQTAAVDVRLKPLEGLGMLRVEDTNPGSELFIDTQRVGKTPWEGTLGVGRHVIWTATTDRGSAPVAVTVLAAQTTLVRASSFALGPPVVIDVQPRTPRLTLDGVPIGQSPWKGRVPVGRYRVEASEPGYRLGRLQLIVPAAPADAQRDVRLDGRLEADPSHPRWPRERPSAPRASIAISGSYLTGATLGAGAETTCPSACSEDPNVVGFAAAARGGFRFIAGLSGEIEAGYLDFGSSFRRLESDTFEDQNVTTGIDYDVHDDVDVRGPYSALGASYRLPFAPRFDALFRVRAGIFLARASDEVSGNARVADTTESFSSEGDGAASSLLPLVAPEVGVETSMASFRLSLTFGVTWLPGPGPDLEHGNLFVPRNCDGTAAPGSIGCASGSDVVARERAFDDVLLWSPTLAVTYWL